MMLEITTALTDEDWHVRLWAQSNMNRQLLLHLRKRVLSFQELGCGNQKTHVIHLSFQEVSLSDRHQAEPVWYIHAHMRYRTRATTVQCHDFPETGRSWSQSYCGTQEEQIEALPLRCYYTTQCKASQWTVWDSSPPSSSHASASGWSLQCKESYRVREFAEHLHVGLGFWRCKRWYMHMHVWDGNAD